MPKKSANISLTSYDDIFSTEETRNTEPAEQVIQIPLAELHPFEGHPFKVLEDEFMEKTAESIKQIGVVTPLIPGAYCILIYCSVTWKVMATLSAGASVIW